MTDQALVLGGTDGTISITPNSTPGDTLDLQVVDADLDLDPGTAETVQISVVNDVSGESETLTLTESGPSTGIFDGTLPTLFDAVAGTDDDGTMNTSVGHSLTATYIDALNAAGGSATVSATGLVAVENAVQLDKTAGRLKVIAGDAVPYALRATNTTAGQLNGVILSDIVPVGFKYVENTALLVQPGPNGQLGDTDDVLTPLTPTGPRPLDFGPIAIGAGESVEVRYLLRIGSGALFGEQENRATPYLAGLVAGNTARAVVDVVEDPILDQSTIVGKVFEDLNRNGVQDPGENGVGQAMVVLDDGQYVLTDSHGRFHFPALLSGWRMLKINVHSLPPGTELTTDDSRIIRLTPGLTGRANFGVVLERTEETIGRSGEAGIAVDSAAEHHPIQVLGRTEELSLLVNDKQVTLAATDVRLRMRGVDQVVKLTGSTLAQPLTFDLDIDEPDAVRRWRVNVMTGDGTLVHSMTGDAGPPRSLTWDGRLDEGGSLVPGEVYFYQLGVDYEGTTQALSARHLFGVGRDSVVSLELAGGAFRVDSDVLSDNARDALDEVGAILAKYPRERVVVEGHTDNQGTSEHNIDLSRRRAQAAAAFLVQAWNIDDQRLILNWYGETRPSVTNDLAEGREINRRVEIRAELDDVLSADVTDQYRTEPSALINDEPMELGRHGRFATEQPADDGAGSLAVELQNSQGRAVSTTIDLPRLEILAPSGSFLVGEQHPEGGCRLEGGALTCELSGRTDFGGTIRLNGQEVMAEPDGTFSTPLDLPVGDHVFGLLARNTEGYSRTANLRVSVQDRDGNGDLLVVTEAIPNLTVALPPPDARLYHKNLPLSGSTDPGNKVTINDSRGPCRGSAGQQRND